MMLGTGPCVYFVEAVGTNRIKIGITKNINSRLSSLECNSPYKLNLIYAFPGYISKEKEIHKRFEHLRIKGEWFKYTNEVKQYILNLSSTIDTIYMGVIEKIKIKGRNKKTNYNKPISLRVSSTVYTLLEDLSKRKDIEISALVRKALNEYIISELGT